MTNPDLNNISSMMDLLHTRRSLVAVKMVAPGPSDNELRQILAAGVRVPDHGRAEPWRIQVVSSEGRRKLIDVQTSIFQQERQHEIEKKLDLLNQAIENVPTLLVITCHPNEEKFAKVPLIEQQLSGGALCQNILIAAHALGYVAQWITGWPAYHRRIKALLGHDEQVDILGFIFIGSADAPIAERPRPEIDRIVSLWPEEKK